MRFRATLAVASSVASSVALFVACGDPFAQCGMINKFERGSAAATFVSFR